MKPQANPTSITSLENHLPTVGKGPFKYQWYSICSMHRDFDMSCHMCNAGFWHHAWGQKVNSLIFKYCPKLWQLWYSKKLKIQ